jgi:hypothetical protein
MLFSSFIESVFGFEVRKNHRVGAAQQALLVKLVNEWKCHGAPQNYHVFFGPQTNAVMNT